MPPLGTRLSPTGVSIIDPAYRAPLALLLLGAALIDQGFSAEQAAGFVGAAGRLLDAEKGDQVRTQIARTELITGCAMQVETLTT